MWKKKHLNLPLSVEFSTLFSFFSIFNNSLSTFHSLLSWQCGYSKDNEICNRWYSVADGLICHKYAVQGFVVIKRPELSHKVWRFFRWTIFPYFPESVSMQIAHLFNKCTIIVNLFGEHRIFVSLSLDLKVPKIIVETLMTI